MSRVKIKEQLVYFPKNIRKNNLHKQSQQRPKTTSHRRFFFSKGYRYIPELKPDQDTTLMTLEFNNTMYKKGESPERKNTNRFLQACHVDKKKQSKIKYNTIEGKIKLCDQNNKMEDFVQALIDSNYFFQRLERTMVESLTLIGTQKKYEKGEKLELPKKNIGFVLYGRLKMFGQDYTFIANRGDTIGQHEIFGHSKQFKLKILEDSAILWVSIANYNILRQESVKEGFRHDFNKIDTQLRLSHIKKKIPKE